MAPGDRSSYSGRMALVARPGDAGEPELAELVGGGRRASRERIAALGVRDEKKRGGRLRDEPRRNFGRRCRNRCGTCEVSRNARRAVRLVVDVVPSLARLLDVCAKPGRRARFGKRNDCRNEELHQAKQRERRNGRPGSERPSSSLSLVGGRFHWGQWFNLRRDYGID